MIIYRPQGVCSKEIRFSLKDGVIEKIEIYGGCNGNLKGITSLITGCDAATVVKKLKGICCGDKTTSCPDQIAIALELALKKNLT